MTINKDGIGKRGSTRRQSNASLTQNTQGSSGLGWLPPHIFTIAGQKKARLTFGALLRGQVVAVYAPDDSSAARSPGTKGFTGKYSPWLCDIQIVENQYRSILPRVPIMTMAFGVTDMVQWKPRASTIDLRDGTSIQLEDSTSGLGTPAHEQDGDWVVVAFLDNDTNKPVIIGQLPHSQTLNPISVNDDPQYKWQARVRGNLIGIQDGGQIDIDATNQTTGTVETDGTESGGKQSDDLDQDRWGDNHHRRRRNQDRGVRWDHGNRERRGSNRLAVRKEPLRRRQQRGGHKRSLGQGGSVGSTLRERRSLLDGGVPHSDCDREPSGASHHEPCGCDDTDGDRILQYGRDHDHRFNGECVMAMNAATLEELILTKLVATGISEADASQWSNLFKAIAEAVVDHLKSAAETTGSDGSPDGGGLQ